MGRELAQNATGEAPSEAKPSGGERRLSARAIWGLFRETYEEWDRDNASTLAAALAYYTAFALAPVIVLAVAAAGFVLERGEVRDEALRQVALMAGPQAAELVGAAVDKASEPGASLTATVLSVGAMVLSATGVFGELQRSLDIVWNVPPSRSSGLKRALRERATAFAVVLAVGLLLLLSLLANAVLEAMGGALPAAAWLTRGLGYPLSFALVTALFALLFKVLPRARVRFRDVWVGAAATAAFFTLGRAALSLYFARSALASSYGAAGSLAALLAWLYYSANVFFFGAEFTQVYASRFGSRFRYEGAADAAGAPGSGPGVAA
ncbi:MAG TPA: YhjD/YihY/BrkB family envelope integrity protein, partial [Polyangiaceae bacterium]|nr:YhjD/YihY/BrkB family envelope integrity protein [Polyangiaceae bacterium]